MEGQDEEPPYFDSFAEYKEFCVQYRARLAQIVRSTAGWLPEQVLYKTSPPRLRYLRSIYHLHEVYAQVRLTSFI